MQVTIHLPKALKDAVPEDNSFSGIVRQMVMKSAENHDLLIGAFAARSSFQAPASAKERYVVYMTPEENAAGAATAERFALSLSNMIQILLEDLLYRAGLWPKADLIDKGAQKD